MTQIYGVDASYDELTPEKARALRAAGIDVFQQCLWDGLQQPAKRVTNLRVAQQAGFPWLCAYSSLTARGGAGNQQMALGRQGVPDDLWGALAFVAVDVELLGITDAQIRAAVEYHASYGKGRVIYTSEGQWQGEQRGSLAFGDCLLSNAKWDRQAVLASPAFGGWTLASVLSKQYTGGEDCNGLFADRDVFSLELLQRFAGGGSQQTGGDVTDADMQKIIDGVNAHTDAKLLALEALLAKVLNIIPPPPAATS